MNFKDVLLFIYLPKLYIYFYFSDELAELSLSGTISSPCVPTVVMMCIRHLEQFGLHTVGIFRVSSSKKRVKQVI